MFDPTAAVLVHSLVTLDAAVFALLKAEETLLIHRCVARADRERRAWSNTGGREVLVVYSGETLLWDVTAGLLDQTGLGNYHPGRALSAQSLEWANGEALPFQFHAGTHGLFIYESPTLDPPPGDLPGVSFRIRLQFGEFALEENPDDGLELGLTGFAEIPAQSPVELGVLWRVELLRVVFTGASEGDSTSLSAFDAEPMTAALYSGDPDAGGVELFAPLDLTAWTTFSETAATVTKGQNQSVIEWTSVVNYERTVTHILFERNGWKTVVPLAAALTVPALSGVRAPVNALALQLTWPWDIASPAPDVLPSRRYLTYALGGTREAAGLGAVLKVVFSSEDLLTEYESVQIPAVGEFWSLADLTARPAIFEGIRLAGVGGWPIMVVTVFSGDTTVLRQRHTLTVPEGGFVRLDGTPVLDLEAAAT